MHRYIDSFIDPDIEKCGVCLVDYEHKVIAIESKSTEEVIKIIVKKSWPKTNIYIEAGWINQGNWHIKNTDSSKVAAEIGRRTGMNHATGQLLARLAKYEGCNVKLVKPVKNGHSKKAKELVKKLSGHDLDEDCRDAFMMAYGVLGEKIKGFEIEKIS